MLYKNQIRMLNQSIRKNTSLKGEQNRKYFNPSSNKRFKKKLNW